MKILAVGDIHAKPWIVHAVEPLVKDYDKVIFLGDYVDDWGALPEMSKMALEALSVLYRRNKYKVVMLRGNHDFSEYYGYKKREFVCSGFDFGVNNLCQLLYENNWDKMLSVYISHGDIDRPIETDYWFSHAGLTSGWDKQWRKYWDALTFEEKSKDSLLDTEVFMAQVGSSRGGMSLDPSPIWADKSELVASPKPYINQVVGHTPVKTITLHEFKNGDGSKNRIFFCDTFSTYPDGTPYGDGSCLSLDTMTGEWEKVYPLDNQKGEKA